MNKLQNSGGPNLFGRPNVTRPSAPIESAKPSTKPSGGGMSKGAAYALGSTSVIKGPTAAKLAIKGPRATNPASSQFAQARLNKKDPKPVAGLSKAVQKTKVGEVTNRSTSDNKGVTRSIRK